MGLSDDRDDFWLFVSIAFCVVLLLVFAVVADHRLDELEKRHAPVEARP